MTEADAKIRRRSGYSAVPNKAMSDRSMSIEARGLLALLMTFKEGWVFRSSHLMSECGVGKDKFYRMLGELKSAGYVRVEHERDAGGVFGQLTWEVFDSPFPEKPDAVNTASGKTGHIRENNLVSDINNKPQTPEGDLFSDNPKPASQSQTPDHFEEFWKLYPKTSRKSNRKGCLEKFRLIVAGRAKSIDRADGATIVAGLKSYVATSPDPQYVPAPMVWLNQARWEAFTGNEPEQISPERQRYRDIVAKYAGVSG